MTWTTNSEDASVIGTWPAALYVLKGPAQEGGPPSKMFLQEIADGGFAGL